MESWNFSTWQIFSPLAWLVRLVTNMRSGSHLILAIRQSIREWLEWVADIKSFLLIDHCWIFRWWTNMNATELATIYIYECTKGWFDEDDDPATAARAPIVDFGMCFHKGRKVVSGAQIHSSHNKLQRLNPKYIHLNLIAGCFAYNTNVPLWLFVLCTSSQHISTPIGREEPWQLA